MINQRPHRSDPPQGLDETPHREDRYEVGEIVAQGAMGVIRRVREVATGREVAMKQMHARQDEADPVLAARFVQEARITAHLEHPNIIPVHEFSPGDRSSQFYTMKMVRGISLDKILGLLRDRAEGTVRKYPLEALLTLFQKVGDALAFAHSKGVIHRDLKPANIMVGEYGEVLVMDWGVAKVIGEAEGLPAGWEESPTSGKDSFATMAGTIMGTPYYMAPEQADGQVQFLDQRSDVYALGAILYELLTLKTPVEGRSAAEVLKNVREGKVIPPLERAGAEALLHLPEGRIPASLAAVTVKAMAYSPERRYQWVGDLQADVRAFQDGRATGAEQASPWRHGTLFVKRNKGVCAAIAASVLVLVVVSGVFTHGVIRERNLANAEKNHAAEAFAQVSLEKKRVAETLGQVEPETRRADAARDQAESETTATQTLMAQLAIEKNRVTETLAKVEPLRLRANAERARAEAESAATQATLAQLRLAAPAFLAQAESFIQKQQVAPALEKLGLAMAIDPGNPTYILRRAHLLEANLQLKEAAEAYQKAGTLGAGSAAALNLTQCEKLLKESAATGRLSVRSARLLHDNIVAQKRDADAIILGNRPEMMDATEALVNERIKPWLTLPAWNDVPNRISRNDDDTYTVVLGSGTTDQLVVVPIADLTPLKGLAIQHFTMSQTKVEDLAPLQGMPLEWLHLNRVPIHTLEPLRGMKLKTLYLFYVPVEDLSPLAGMPLETLYLRSTKVHDLSPLKGMALKSLIADGTDVNNLSALNGMRLRRVSLTYSGSDLSPIDNPNLTSLVINEIGSRISEIRNLGDLRTAPLSSLSITGATKLVDIETLRGKPLTQVFLTGCENIRDLSPLAACPTITSLRLPGPIQATSPWAASLKTLRSLPNLKSIAYGTGPQIPPAEFWAEYDRNHPK